jgi:hypothetical protein
MQSGEERSSVRSSYFEILRKLRMTEGFGVAALQKVSFPLMDEPEYLICLQCETPTYQFEMTNGKVTASVCTTCGNDDVSEFMTEAELEELA